MNRVAPHDGVECTLVTSPAHRPSIGHVTNCNALVRLSSRENENIIGKLGGGADVYRLGEDRTDGALNMNSASREDAEIIEELRRLGIPVYIYPRFEGAGKFMMPLIRGTGTDPVDDITVTHTLTLASDTTLYLIEGDAATGYHLRETKASVFPYMRGVASSNCEVGEFPSGRGYAALRPVKNFLPDGAFATFHAAPHIAGEWSFAGGVFNTNCGLKDSPWHDGNSLWLYTTASTVKSPGFVLNNVTTDTHFSFLYRVSGTLRVTIDYGGGVTDTYDLLSGSGYFNQEMTRTGSFAAVNLTFVLTAGEYAEFAVPQFIHILGEKSGQYRACIVGSGNAVQGELTASRLSVESAEGFGMDVWPQGAAATVDGAVVVAGLFMPNTESLLNLNHSTIAFVDNTIASGMGDFELRFGGNAGTADDKFNLVSGGTVRDSALVSGHVLGDVYGWALCSGYDNNSGKTGATIVRLRDGTNYTLVSSAEVLAFPNRIHIGCRSTAGYNAQGIVGAVTVSACKWDECPLIAGRLGDYEQVDYWRRLLGRQMKLKNTLSPRAVSREFWENSIPFVEIDAI